jgi:lipase ATG15
MYRFSCCCAKVDSTWKPICDCYKGKKGGKSVCDNSCISKAVNFKHSYFNMARQVYNQVRALYPESQIWFVGHSLGGMF